MSSKIFCVGLNKTGTTSLDKAFKMLGFKTVHFKDDRGNNIKDIIQDNYLSGKNILNRLEKYDVFSDWTRVPYNLEIIKEFDRQYPNSKFILNTRDLEGWLNSREKHVKRNQEKKRKKPNAKVVWLTIDREAWEQEYKEHYKGVLEYFAGREDDLLVFDVIKGDGWEKLCPFLNLPIPAKPFPQKNIAPSNRSFVYNFLYRLKKYI